MNDYLMKLLTDKIINSFPEEEKEIYNYVIQMEDQIAEEVATPAEFMNRLHVDSPHKLAAQAFDLTLFQLLQMLKQVDEKIAHQLEPMLKAVQWKDCTELINERGGDDTNRKLFYVSIP